jgi:hypothetical protein
VTAPSAVAPHETTREERAKALTASILIGGRSGLYLDELVKKVGARPAGSSAGASAEKWAAERLEAVCDRVIREPVTLEASWTRGEAKARILTPEKRELTAASVGWTPPTAKGGVTGPLVLVTASDAEALAKKEGLAGSVVLLDRAIFKPNFAVGTARMSKLWRGLADAGVVGVIWPWELEPSGRPKGVGRLGNPRAGRAPRAASSPRAVPAVRRRDRPALGRDQRKLPRIGAKRSVREMDRTLQSQRSEEAAMNMPTSPTIDVVVRCRNEMPFTRDMLAQTLRQRGVRPRVLFMDCSSTDGSREVADALGVRIVDVDAKTYMPGAVLNRGMQLTSSEIVAFVNADCIPLGSGELRALVAPLFEEPRLAATYGRQIARPSADPLVAVEYERAFGEEAPRLRRGTFFSMAASAIRRDAWAVLPFDPTLRFSEDVDWTTRIAALHAGEDEGGIRYAPEARFEHSHDYDVRGQFARRRGEGKADAAIHRLGPPTLLDLIRPLGGALVRDAGARVLSPRGVLTRFAQAVGYYQGRRDAVAIAESGSSARRVA